MAIYHHTTRMIGRSNGGSPVKALAYITGSQLVDQRTNEVFDFMNKSVDEIRILLPEDAPGWAREIQKLVCENKDLNERDPNNRAPSDSGTSHPVLDNRAIDNRAKGLQLLSDIVNAAEKRGDAQVYREIEFSLPRELSDEQNKALAVEYVQDQFCGMGMLAIQSFHTEVCEKTGELNPHCHTFLLTRELTEEGLALKKNRDWNQKSVHESWREQWASYASFHLKMHGHDITLDHRSYKDQGLDIEPQVKLGKGVCAQEKRAKTKEYLGDTPLDQRQDVGLNSGLAQDLGLPSGEDSNSKIRTRQDKGFVESVPATDRVQELRSIQLRNLYRIMRRPETVLDIVTRHHATFMWGDVQKILGRYVDDVELFQRLDARLRSSSELILLKMEGVRDQTGRIEERAIYTTRSMLRAENALLGTAEALSGNVSHGVSPGALRGGLERIQMRLQKEGLAPGYSLSEDQERAIRHLVDEGQLKCIVGYAGAGKTTALEACRDIWESEGYKVYGLAPTGRAAQNLEGSGISSQTLHKFLKSFEEGRCQYSRKSVLVLDEAGMVDVERFDKFLGAVKALGVKAVVVGDGAQLQPVEAGPAFRLVTEKVGVSRLEEVVRQKETWQREATVLFGKQDSKAAIQLYQRRGHIHLVEEPLKGGISKGNLSKETEAEDPIYKETLSEGEISSKVLGKHNLNKGVMAEGSSYQELPLRLSKVEDTLRQYEVATRTSGLIFREMMKEIKGKDENDFEESNSSHPPSKHQGRSQSLSQYDEDKQLQGLGQHRDYPQFLKWKEMQKEAAVEILGHADDYREALERRGLDPHGMARLFVDKKQDKASQYRQAIALLKSKGLDHLSGVERSLGHSVEVRSAAKAALIKDWHQAYQDKALLGESPPRGSPLSGSMLMMAYSNRDVRDLNTQARNLLKASGAIGREDFTYTITREVEDDFGRRTKVKEQREFSKGDRIVFTRNNHGLGVKNGTIGTITDLNTQNIKVRVGEESTQLCQEISFAPKLNPYFDQGWAITIHKSQGTTVDKSFLLASHEMNQNLTYVAMTRHREDVHVYGSTLDFWRPEKVSDILSKSGEKLGAADYLDAQSLSLLMHDEDKFLNRLFTRLSDELHAMGAVSKRAFGIVAEHFLGRSFNDNSFSDPSFNDTNDPLRRAILLKPETLIKGALIKGALIKETIREEDRAHDILKKTPEQREHRPGTEVFPLESSLKNSLESRTLDIPGLQNILTQQKLKINHTLQDVYEDWKHPAFKNAGHYKLVFEEGLKLHGDHTGVSTTRGDSTRGKHIHDHTRVDDTNVSPTSGEAAAIEYWNTRREPFLDLYEKKLEAVAAELASPLLSYMSEESRKLAYVCALEDPDKALEFLGSVKTSKQAELDAQTKSNPLPSPALKSKEAPIPSPQVNPHSKDASLKSSSFKEQPLKDENAAMQKNVEEAMSAYFRFRELKIQQMGFPHDSDIQNEMHEIGKSLVKNKEMFSRIESLDPEMSKLIKQQADLKTKELMIEKQLEHDRGGYSM